MTDGPGWRGVMHSCLLFPLGLVSFILTVTFWAVRVRGLTYPVWYILLPDGIPIWQPYDPLDTLGESFIVAGVGLVLVFVTPWVVRGCAAVRRVMARGLLGRIGEEG